MGITVSSAPVWHDKLVNIKNPDNISGLASRVETAMQQLLDNQALSPCWVDLGALTAEATATNGGLLSVANPFGKTVYIIGMIMDVTTAVTGSATADVGVAADGTTSSDTLMDEINVGAAAIVGNTEKHKGTNGMGMVKMTVSQFITATSSADSTGVVGNAYALFLVPTA